MFRRLSDLTRRFLHGVRQTLGDFVNVLMMPFRGGFHPWRSCKAFGRELAHFVGNVSRQLDPRQLPAVIARDSKTLVAGSQTLALETTATATGFGSMILRSPVTIGRWLITLPGRSWQFLRTRTKSQLLVLTLFLGVGATAFSWPTYMIVKEKRRDILRKEQERQLDIHLSRSDIAGVRHNLSAINSIYPKDANVAARLASLDSGVSEPNDFRIARLLMQDHYRHRRLAEAKREALKYLAASPKEWDVLVVLADIALRQNDRTTAQNYIQRLDNPRDLPPWVCLIAFQLLQEFGETDRLNAMLDMITDDYVPIIRTGVLSVAEPGYKLAMVQLYNLALTRLAERPKLKSHWVPIQEVCHSIANSKETPASVLINLGHCQESHLELFLRRFLELQLITAEEHKQFAQEIEDRLTSIWQRVRTEEPGNRSSYIGLAMQQARVRKYEQAIQIIDEGIAKCGKSTELVEKKSEIMRRTDPAASLAFLESEQGDRSPTLNMCKLIAQAALAAHRPDRALKIIAKAHALQPNLPWVCQLEAEALMQAGRPTEAAATLQRVLPQISADPVGIVAYIQALAASGSVTSAEAYLLKELEAQPNNPVVAVGADAVARLGHLEAAVRILRQVLQHQRGNSYAHFLLGDCLRQIAEQNPNGWDLEMVRESIKHYRATLDRYPNNLQAINNIAWLQLLALHLPRDAFDSINIMQQVADLPAPMLETVGAVLVANGSFDAGRKYLERSIRLGGERATTLAFLADAYRGLNRSTDALVAMRKSLNLPKNNPREAELVNEIRHHIERLAP